jgi:septal ring factor EnvC (AmiA/AmiB activator)
LNEPNLAKKLGYVEKAVVEKCEDLTYLKTRRVPGLEENLRDGIEVIEQQKVNLEQYSRDLAEQREQHKSDLAEQREQYERERAEQQEFMREQREYMEYLRSQMPKRENASNDSNTENTSTTNTNEGHGDYKPSHW